MLRFAPRSDDDRLRVLCLGAHSDDIEIGCAGTLLRWLDEYERVEVTWVVLCAEGERATEARGSAEAILRRAAAKRIIVGDFRDGHFPAHFDRVKEFMHRVRQEAACDLVLTHRLDDRHQDHRTVGEVTWQTWRDHVVLEYEIPKYEGDLGQPNFFVPITASQRDRKVQHLDEWFGTQRSKDWFRQETFDAMMRLRGIECRSVSGYAEAFHARKLVF